MTHTTPLLGQPRTMDDWVVTLTPLPDLTEVLARGPRRRAQSELQRLKATTTGSHADARPNQLEAPALTSQGTIRVTLSREDGPAGHGDNGTQHWHLAMSLDVDGQCGPAPVAELAAWIAVGWAQLDAVDTYVIAGILTARHTHLPI